MNRRPAWQPTATLVAWRTTAALAAGVAAYALVLVIGSAARPGFVRALLLTVPTAVFLHLLGSAVALALGPWQLNAGFRARNPARHRLLGRIYLAGVLLGGLAGVRLAFLSRGGWIAHAGFAALGTLWIATALAAYVAIRRGDRRAHRAWMSRNFALTFAAVTLRIELPASLALGVAFEHAYPAIAWLCWLPNLAVAERWLVPAPAAPDQGAQTEPLGARG